MQAGHVLIDGGGRLVGLDQGFCDIMQSDHGALIGRLVADVTAPADREECHIAISTLRETGRPFRITKRFMLDNGSLVWVTNSVSILAHQGDPQTLVATIDPMVDALADRAPALLLDCARMMVDLQEDRGAIFDTAIFSDTAWDAILAAYIAEAEGRAIDGEALALRLGISRARADRWIAVLLGQKAIEIETRETDPYAPKSFRLTGLTHARLEEHLSRAGRLHGALGRRSAAVQ